ncbi:MAG: VWA domain-containing protein, partial [Caldimonas sp.]
MAEAEDVITDVARHATIFARDLWRRHRPAAVGPAQVALADVAPRLDLLIAAVFGHGFPLRSAQSPARPTLLARLLQRQRVPRWSDAVGATDGRTIWLPAALLESPLQPAATAQFRALALRQAMRAVRGSAATVPAGTTALVRDLFLLLEAHAADHELQQLLAGMAEALADLRKRSLAARPPLAAFPEPMRALERFVRASLAPTPDVIEPGGSLGLPAIFRLALPATPAANLALAQAVGRAWPDALAAQGPGPWLWRDQWSGELRPAPTGRRSVASAQGDDTADDDRGPPRSARLVRRPDVREALDDEDDASPGAWMVQTAAPQEMAEDPMGLSRPTDRDTDTAADDYADALSELQEARLVSAPGKPQEVLLSDDPPESSGPRPATATVIDGPTRLHYPEWDWRAGGYRHPGASVWLLPATAGPQRWVDDTLAARGAMLHEIRRRFELLRAQRVRQRRQLDGPRIDLQAFIDGRAAYRAGLPLAQRLYQSERRGRRDLAVLLLVDVSGSTDSTISGHQRVIDVEREALLLVCTALDGLQAAYSVQAFSGEGPDAVIVRSVKNFDEAYGDPVAQRIAGLEPEHYTRAGAALRHASALLMREAAEHRLLLVLSDGKPNDVDDYEGRYGVEDMRQAVTEARLQGIAPFCLTVDRQAANYLPFVFGPQ